MSMQQVIFTLCRSRGVCCRWVAKELKKHSESWAAFCVQHAGLSTRLLDYFSLTCIISMGSSLEISQLSHRLLAILVSCGLANSRHDIPSAGPKRFNTKTNRLSLRQLLQLIRKAEMEHVCRVLTLCRRADLQESGPRSRQARG